MIGGTITVSIYVGFVIWMFVSNVTFEVGEESDESE